MQVFSYPFKFEHYVDQQNSCKVYYATSRQFADFFAESWSEDALLDSIFDYLDGIASRGALPQPLDSKSTESIITYVR